MKKPRPQRNTTYRIDRPPTRIYVTVDELGTNRAHPFKGDAIQDAVDEAYLFGDANVYEYRLVDKRPRYRAKRS